jgi:hypothetical protein
LNQPNADHLMPGYKTHRTALNLAGALIFMAGSFVPRGNFWNKAAGIVYSGAKAHFPAAT